MKEKSQLGYTLIEMIVVIGIIGVLLALSVPAYNQFVSPQEFRTASLQLKTDLRMLQNRAASGVTAKRTSIDTNDNGVIDGTESTDKVDVRVYWVARFKNNTNQYELGACQKNLSGSRLGTATEAWGSCSDKVVVRLPSRIRLSACTTSCADYSVYFTPIYGGIEIYNSDLNVPTTPVTSAPIKVTFTSQVLANRSIFLNLNQDGSLTESCTSNSTTINCN